MVAWRGGPHAKPAAPLNPVGPLYVLEMHEDYVERCNPEHQLMVHAIPESGRNVRIADTAGIIKVKRVYRYQCCHRSTNKLDECVGLVIARRFPY